MGPTPYWMARIFFFTNVSVLLRRDRSTARFGF